jgi:hypothetical protein
MFPILYTKLPNLSLLNLSKAYIIDRLLINKLTINTTDNPNNNHNNNNNPTTTTTTTTTTTNTVPQSPISTR